MHDFQRDSLRDSFFLRGMLKNFICLWYSEGLNKVYRKGHFAISSGNIKIYTLRTCMLTKVLKKTLYLRWSIGFRFISFILKHNGFIQHRICQLWKGSKSDLYGTARGQVRERRKTGRGISWVSISWLDDTTTLPGLKTFYSKLLRSALTPTNARTSLRSSVSTGFEIAAGNPAILLPFCCR